jgi:uncharacterized membrane protein
MDRKNHAQLVCQICKKKFKSEEIVHAGIVRAAVANLIKQDYPNWSEEEYICINDLNRYRARYVESMLADEQGELSTIQKEVADSLVKHETLSENLLEVSEKTATFGERLSDSIARIGGSWGFIVSFSIFLACWMIINTIFLISKPFDPYPYILLNLVLSTLAAIQAPVIMMSQRRQEARDRLRAVNDYRVNLKAELEIRHLHEKVDHLLTNQWNRLMDIQSIQIDLIEEIKKSTK